MHIDLKRHTVASPAYTSLTQATFLLAGLPTPFVNNE